MYIAWLLLIATFICGSQAKPDGAPNSSCKTLLPVHGGGIKAQQDNNVYLISPKTLQVVEGGEIDVTIVSPQSVEFQGFMLQARVFGSDTPIGSFVNFDRNQVHTIQCFNAGDTVTHNSPQEKRSVTVTWQAPPGFQGQVVFTGTVAQSYAVFWVGIESNPIDVVDASNYRPDNNPTYNSPPPRGTTPSIYRPTTDSSAFVDRADPFYQACGVTKSCFGSPNGCVQEKNCKAVVATIVRGERYEFELRATSGSYVAVGLSDDDKMGDDSTIECVRDNNGVQAFMGYTTKGPYDALRLPRPKEGIQLLNTSYVNGVLYCLVRRDLRTVVRDKTYDLANEKYYVMLANGDAVSPNKIHFHTIAYAVSDEKRALSDTQDFRAASKLLIRLHGAFMIAAWIGTASIGILLARYYRQTWTGSQLCGKDQWFAWHRFFMALTWLLTIAGFVLIWVELKAWSEARNPHAILGTVTTILCFIQPIGAFFRPHPDTPKRPLFNWVHWLFGNSAHIVGIVAIFFAVKLNKAELPDWMDWILVAYVAFHVIMHLILSILGCITDRPNGHRVSSFPMKDMAGSGHGRNSAIHAERKMDAPHAGFRKFLLTIYLLGVILLVAALIVIVVLAPIEEQWASMKMQLNQMKT